MAPWICLALGAVASGPSVPVTALPACFCSHASALFEQLLLGVAPPALSGVHCMDGRDDEIPSSDVCLLLSSSIISADMRREYFGSYSFAVAMFLCIVWSSVSSRAAARTARASSSRSFCTRFSTSDLLKKLVSLLCLRSCGSGLLTRASTLSHRCLGSRIV